MRAEGQELQIILGDSTEREESMVTPEQLHGLVVGAKKTKNIQTALACKAGEIAKLREEKRIANCISIIDEMLQEVAKSGGIDAEFAIADWTGYEPAYIPEKKLAKHVMRMHMVSTDELWSADAQVKLVLTRLCEHYKSLGFIKVKIRSVIAYGQYKGHHYRLILGW